MNRDTANPRKKKYSEPELIVMVRHNEDEAVLTGCKWDPAGPTALNGTCRQAPCTACSSFVES